MSMRGSQQTGLSPIDVLYGALADKQPRLREEASKTLKLHRLSDLGIIEHGYFTNHKGWSGSNDWIVANPLLPDELIRDAAPPELTPEAEHLIQQIETEYSNPGMMSECRKNREYVEEGDWHLAYKKHLTHFNATISENSTRGFTVPTSQLQVVEQLSPRPGQWKWARADRNPEQGTAGEALFYVDDSANIFGNVRIPKYYTVEEPEEEWDI